MTMAEGAISKRRNLEAEGDASDTVGCQPNIHSLHLHCWQFCSFPIHTPQELGESDLSLPLQKQTLLGLSQSALLTRDLFTGVHKT